MQEAQGLEDISDFIGVGLQFAEPPVGRIPAGRAVKVAYVRGLCSSGPRGQMEIGDPVLVAPSAREGRRIDANARALIRAFGADAYSSEARQGKLQAESAKGGARGLTFQTPLKRIHRSRRPCFLTVLIKDLHISVGYPTSVSVIVVAQSRGARGLFSNYFARHPVMLRRALRLFLRYGFFLYARTHRHLVRDNRHPPRLLPRMLFSARQAGPLDGWIVQRAASPRTPEPQRRRLDFLPLGYHPAGQAPLGPGSPIPREARKFASASSAALRPG